MYIFRRKEKKSNKNQITLIGINSIKVRENSTTSVIILNVNGLTIPSKRQRSAE